MNGVPAKVDIAQAAVCRSGAIAKALDVYRWDMGAYPTTDEGLVALCRTKGEVSDDRFDGPYLPRAVGDFGDPWGHPYNYRSPGEFNVDFYDLWSRSPDGKEDGGARHSDDITNRRPENARSDS